MRYAGAIVYDSLLLLGVWFISIGISNLILQGTSPAWLVQTILLGEWYTFFVYFWTKGGQTAGMRAWRTRLVTVEATTVGIKAASLRFVCAFVSALPALLGYLWMYIDKDKRTWHDKLSQTQIVYIPKSEN